MRQDSEKNPIILMSGGGTAGSVTPLLAIAEILKRHQTAVDFVWLGTASGPERQLVEEAGIPFTAISAGKFRRYWSWDNFKDSWRIMVGFRQAYQYLKKYRPALVLSAGSFVSVPVAWAAKLLAIPVIIEQLDYHPGLANRAMKALAKQVLVTFDKSQQDYGTKAIWLGAPISQKLWQVDDDPASVVPWQLSPDRPAVLIVGGGTGAAAINDLVKQQLADLVKLADIIHLTGRGKETAAAQEHYFPIDFLNQQQMMKAYRAVDLVVARAGLGTMIELAALKKPSIIVPMPASHQVENGRAIERAGAAIVIEEKRLAAGGLARLIGQILNNQPKQQELVNNWPQAIKIADEAEIVKIFEQYL